MDIIALLLEHGADPKRKQREFGSFLTYGARVPALRGVLKQRGILA